MNWLSNPLLLHRCLAQSSDWITLSSDTCDPPARQIGLCSHGHGLGAYCPEWLTVSTLLILDICSLQITNSIIHLFSQKPSSLRPPDFNVLIIITIVCHSMNGWCVPYKYIISLSFLLDVCYDLCVTETNWGSDWGAGSEIKAFSVQVQGWTFKYPGPT